MISQIRNITEQAEGLDVQLHRDAKEVLTFGFILSEGCLLITQTHNWKQYLRLEHFESSVEYERAVSDVSPQDPQQALSAVQLVSVVPKSRYRLRQPSRRNAARRSSSGDNLHGAKCISSDSKCRELHSHDVVVHFVVPVDLNHASSTGGLHEL